MPCCCHRQVPSNGGEGRVKIMGFVGFIGNGRELFHRYIGMSPSNLEYDRHILNHSPRAWTSANTSKQGIQGLKTIGIHLLEARCTSIWECHPDRRTIPFSSVSGTTIEPHSRMFVVGTPASTSSTRTRTRTTFDNASERVCNKQPKKLLRLLRYTRLHMPHRNFR